MQSVWIKWQFTSRTNVQMKMISYIKNVELINTKQQVQLNAIIWNKINDNLFYFIFQMPGKCRVRNFYHLILLKTRICAAEMAVRYAVLCTCRKVHTWRWPISHNRSFFFYFGCSLVRRCNCKQNTSANGTDGQTDRQTDGQTDRQTDRQSATQYAAPS